MSFLFPKSSSLPLIPPSPNRSGQALDEAPRAGRLASRLRGGRTPTILTDSRLAQGADGETGSSEEARLTPGLAARLRDGRAPTILTGARLSGGEPAGDAGKPAATVGVPKEEARQRTEDVAFLHRREGIRPKAQGEIDTFKRNPDPEKPHIFHMEESRRLAILSDWPNVRFNIEDNPEDDGGRPPHSRHKDYVITSSKHNGIIRQEGKKQSVGPDPVRLIMYVDNAHRTLPRALSDQIESI